MSERDAVRPGPPVNADAAGQPAEDAAALLKNLASGRWLKEQRRLLQRALRDDPPVPQAGAAPSRSDTPPGSGWGERRRDK